MFKQFFINIYFFLFFSNMTMNKYKHMSFHPCAKTILALPKNMYQYIEAHIAKFSSRWFAPFCTPTRNLWKYILHKCVNSFWFLPMCYMKMASYWNINLPFSVRLGIELNLFTEQILIESLLCASFIQGDGNKSELNIKSIYMYLTMHVIIHI